ncbi:neprilysin-2-like [Chelonus insularis]|uniref:neprilysin-2-like n=1 Tax=Chelonus insularis TaxID=460826 RepID=UPI00158D79AE|nr:neprilysin-2-like [Chelonus insularis]
MEMPMMNNGKHTIVKNPTWWKRRSALERGLTVIAVSGVLVCIALAISIGVVVTNSRSCDTATTTGTGEQQHQHYSRGICPSSLCRQRYNNTPPSTLSTKDVCYTPECIHVASKILNNMNPNIDPCDDFYKFACGGFINTTRIQDEKIIVDNFSITNSKILEQLRTTIEEKDFHNEIRPFKLVKELYSICMNKTAIEEQGLNPVLRILKDVGGYPVLEGDSWNEDDFHWMELIYKLRDIGYSYNYLLEFSIGVDLKNSSKKMFGLDQTPLGLSREYLMKGLDDKIVKAYYNYMVDVAIILGAERERAKTELMESLLFEINLANISVSGEHRRNASMFYNPMTIAELLTRYPSVPWKDYFNRILRPIIEVDENEIINVKAPNFFKNFEDLIIITPKRTIANYIMQRVAAGSVSFLNDEIRKKQLQFSRVVTGKTEREPRWMECISIVSGRLSLSVGALYVKKYFNENAKKNAVEMVRDIKQQFSKMLETVDWMDKKTRKHAILKAATMTTHIAYPDELLNDTKLEDFYKNLEFSKGDFLGSMLNLTIFGRNYSFSNFRKPINKSDWITHGRPAIVNAFYSFSENSIQFPAGILQGVFFSNDRPRYMNYGAIGFVIGHEITHGFDDRGRQFDMRGNLVDWWAPATKEKYLEKAKCIVNQYGNFTVREVGLNLNGINTQGENIADNGGIKEAYLAYKEWSKRNKPEPRLPGLDYSPRQMFWISAANMWCSVTRPETLKLRITTGFHSPSEFRILGPLSNMPEFAEDFQCPIGSRMNPHKKCRIW